MYASTAAIARGTKGWPPILTSRGRHNLQIKLAPRPYGRKRWHGCTASAANEMFRRNSERLQETSRTRANPHPTKSLNRFPRFAARRRSRAGHYNDLKLEHADAIGRESDDGQTNERDTGERELTFVKDAGRENHASLKQEQSVADTQEQEQETGDGS